MKGIPGTFKPQRELLVSVLLGLAICPFLPFLLPHAHSTPRAPQVSRRGPCGAKHTGWAVICFCWELSQHCGAHFQPSWALAKVNEKVEWSQTAQLWFPSVHKAHQSPSPDTHPLTFLLLAWASPGAQTPSSSPQRTWALHLAALSTSFPEFIISFVFKSFIKFFFVTNLQGMEFHNCIVYYRRTYFSPCCPLCSLWILFLLFLPLLPSPWHWPFYISCSDTLCAFSVIFSTGKS